MFDSWLKGLSDFRDAIWIVPLAILIAPLLALGLALLIGLLYISFGILYLFYEPLLVTPYWWYRDEQAKKVTFALLLLKCTIGCVILSLILTGSTPK
jgi:hypothetical protein